MRASSPPREPNSLTGRLMQRLGRALMARRSVTHEVVFSLVAVAVATALRFLLDDTLPPGFPFLTYFPAVMLTLVFSSQRSGIAVGVACGLLAWYFFIPGSSSPIGTILALALYTLIIATDILFITAATRALEMRTEAEERAKVLAHSRSLMFSELQHRISNNLSTVAALLRLQSQQLADETARQALIASQTRIRSISLLQRRLHSPDRQMLDAADYLREVAGDVVEVAGTGQVALSFQMDSLPLPPDAAVPLGLIASELIMNAIEHGATVSGGTPVRIALSVRGVTEQGRTAAILEIADEGRGLPAGFDLAASDSLGLIVARQFATALNGELRLERRAQGGTVARLDFAIDAPQEDAGDLALFGDEPPPAPGTMLAGQAART
ncbi:sensor histidine kinase [Paracoccus sp. T5]|uniref:sensor histidine kinase n=1 Tax=Paracoccus sp. T5 TaxID=3402161 RepID=UPI003AE669C8